VSGVIGLQGRLTPITSGTVTFEDVAGSYASTVVMFDPSTGEYAALVPALIGGTTYTVTASHDRYLSNRTVLTFMAGSTYVQPPVVLRGGDANLSGGVDIADLACVGGSYGGPAAPCGAGNSDINADGFVNLFDLVIVAGNHGRAEP
jgi:hypothetical protein